MKIPILISYSILKSKRVLTYIEKYPNRFEIIVDSGAYSMLTRGLTVTVEEYSEWIKTYSSKVQCNGFFQLDVIYDQQKTKKNLALHEKLGAKVIPVFTYASCPEEIELLNNYVSLYSYVGVGGVRKKKNYAHWLLQNCKDISKIHLFAFSDSSVLKCYKPCSCDHSTWLTNGMQFGKIMRKDLSFHQGSRIDLNTLRLSGIQEKDYDKLNDPMWRRGTDKYLSLSIPYALSTSAYLNQAVLLKKLGVTMYFVIVESTQAEVLDLCYQYFIEQKPIDLFRKD